MSKTSSSALFTDIIKSNGPLDHVLYVGVVSESAEDGDMHLKYAKDFVQQTTRFSINRGRGNCEEESKQAGRVVRLLRAVTAYFEWAISSGDDSARYKRLVIRTVEHRFVHYG